MGKASLKNQIKAGLKEGLKVKACPYCAKRLDEIKEHRLKGHPV